MKPKAFVAIFACIVIVLSTVTGCDLFFQMVNLREFHLFSKVTHIAGSIGGCGSADGIGSAARFNNPFGITTDESFLYVSDTVNNTIRKIDKSTGEVTTIAGKAGSSGSDDGTDSARFYDPSGITSDGSYLYVADLDNSTIRKIDKTTGEVTTIAGKAGIGGSDDGNGGAARFKGPFGITSDESNLYVADFRNNTIRMIEKGTWDVTTIAGTALLPGSADGNGGAALPNSPCGITSNESYLYITYSNNTIRKIEKTTRTVTTIAGTAFLQGSDDGNGGAARFFFPHEITSDGTCLYVADSGNHTIRKIEKATGNVTTIAGNVGSFGSDDGTDSARFSDPSGITSDGACLYVADTHNSTIRKIEKGIWVVTTIAGTAFLNGSDDGTGSAGRFNYPDGITSDGSCLYVADSCNHTIRMLIKDEEGDWTVTTIAGKAGSPGSDDGNGGAARFYFPHGITSDGSYLYVTDLNNHTIRKIDSAGNVTTIAGKAGISGSDDGNGGAARFNFPYKITSDGSCLYVADTFNHTIRRIDKKTLYVMTIAGKAGSSGSADGTGISTARFNYPNGITSDGSYLYVADSGNHTIRMIEKETWYVKTIAGKALLQGSEDGTGYTARFYNPIGIASDGSYLYVADTYNNAIRRIE